MSTTTTIPTPTMAHVSFIVAHGYLIDTEHTFRDGGMPTIMCPNNAEKWSTGTWRSMCQIVKTFQLCDMDDGGCDHSPVDL